MTPVQRGSLLAAILGSSIVFLDGTVVNIALPSIGEDLPGTLIGTLEGQTYVTSGYLASLAALLVLAGALGDFHGRRRIFLLGLAGFGITSLLCGLAPSLELLVVFRVLQGAAGAFLVPGALAIISALFEGSARARAFGIWAAATSAVSTLGPPFGGILVDLLSWRAAFLVNVPLLALAVWLTVRWMPETRAERASPAFDWLGSFVAIIAVGGLAFGAVRGQQARWEDPTAFVGLGIGVVAAAAFPILMLRRPHPLVPPGLFGDRTFAVVNLGTLVIYGVLYTALPFQSLLLQDPLGYTALGAAITMLPIGLILSVASVPIGTLAGRVGTRSFLALGPLVMAAAMAWWARIPPTSAPWAAHLDRPGSLLPPLDVLLDPLPAVILFGIGLSLVVAPLTTTIMGSIPVHDAGLGSAINNAISRVGQPLLSALTFVVISATFYATLAGQMPGLDLEAPELRALLQPLRTPGASVDAGLADAARAASTEAFRLASLLMAALLVTGAAVHWFGLRGSPSARLDRRLS